MKFLKRWGSDYIIVTLLCFLAIWPFLHYASLPHDTDAELHIFRLAELRRMIEGGIFYPRWAANFYYGYGYPIFNYYAPLAYYLGALLTLIPTVTPVLSVKLLFIGGFLGAGWGMFAFVNHRWGRVAGWVAATSYLYAPYLLYVDPHARGVLPEFLSFAIFPWALWAIGRIYFFPSRFRIVVVIGLIAATILIHNLMAMVLGGLLFSYFLWLTIQENGFLNRGFLRGLLIWGLGIGAATFFWLPMVAEQNAIQISGVIGAGSHYDYHNHFLTLRELFGPSLRHDWGAVGSVYRLNLGVTQSILGGIGLLTLFWQGARHRFQLIFFGVMAVLLLLLMLPITAPIWETIPVLPYLQFPWRLLGAESALLAVLGGAGIGNLLRSVNKKWLEMGIATVIIIVTIVEALPLLELPAWGEFGDTSAQTVLNQELLGRWRGTTSTADFVPSTVIIEPREQGQLVEEYQQNRPIERLNRATLGSATVTTEIINPVHTKYHVDTADELTLRIFRFYFPGWHATVDGQPVPIIPSQPEGWITVPLKAGQHVVELEFGTTPVRVLSWIITAVAVIGTILLVRFSKKQEGRERELVEKTPSFASESWLLVTAVSVMIVLYLGVIRPSGVLHWDSADYFVQPAQNHLNISFGDEIALIGWDAPDEIEIGRTNPITLYWQAQRPITNRYQVFVHLLRVDDGVTLMAQSDKNNPGDFPTVQWPLDRYVRDPHLLQLPPDLPLGRYQLTVGLWLQQSGERLPIGDLGGDWYVLREFELK